MKRLASLLRGSWDPAAHPILVRTVFLAWAAVVLVTFALRSEVFHRVEVTMLYLLELFR